ncbi:hypothetical protein D9M71_106550 [compost metagenome]
MHDEKAVDGARHPADQQGDQQAEIARHLHTDTTAGYRRHQNGRGHRRQGHDGLQRNIDFSRQENEDLRHHDNQQNRRLVENVGQIRRGKEGIVYGCPPNQQDHDEWQNGEVLEH